MCVNVCINVCVPHFHTTPATALPVPAQAANSDHLSTYSFMDISLDPYPYAGVWACVVCLIFGDQLKSHWQPSALLCRPFYAAPFMPRMPVCVCVPVCVRAGLMHGLYTRHHTGMRPPSGRCHARGSAHPRFPLWLQHAVMPCKVFSALNVF